MWFKKRAKNRKLNRELVLDVRLRHDAARLGHARVAARILTLIFGGLAAGFIAWWSGAWALNRFIYQNPSLAIDRIEVINRGGLVSEEQIRRWAGVAIGENLMALDMRKVRRNLELVPVVESALVKRGMPRTLFIEVVEREAVAQIHVAGQTTNGIELIRYMVDFSGIPMHPRDFGTAARAAADSMENLTVLLGLSADQVRPGMAIELPKLRAALRLVDGFNRTDLVGVTDLASIDLAPPEVMVVKTSQGASVTLAPHSIQDQLRRWRLVHDRASSFGKAVASLDLSITNNNPAVWIEASLAPTVPRKPVKPLRSRRKNA